MHVIYEKYYKNISLVIAFALVLGFLIYNDFGINVYGDAYGYSIMADEMIAQGLGNFHLRLEPESSEAFLFSVRGYAWPFILAIFKTLGFGTNMGYTFWWAFFLTMGFAFYMPELIGRVCKRKIGIIGRLSTLLLTMFFFPGLMIYPLSDLPALILIVLSLYLFYRIKDHSIFYKSIGACIIGFFLGMAYYVRQGSITSMFIIALLMFIISDKSWIKRILLTVLLVGGVIISALPQIMINSDCNGRMTYEVPISFTTGLATMEYRYGIMNLRYETNISGVYPDNPVTSEDQLADTFFRLESIPLDGIGPKELLTIIFKYPVEAIGMFAAKFANSIDSRYGELYISDWHRNRHFVIIANFALWFLGIVGVLYHINHFRQNETLGIKKELLYIYDKREIVFVYIILAGPALFHLAGTHVEPRYFYPAYVVIWSYLGMICPWRSFLPYLKEHFFSLLLIFIALFGCVSSMWNFTMEKIPYFSYFYQQKPVIWEGETYLDLSEVDQTDVFGCTNQFEYDAEEQKLNMWGSCGIQESLDKNIKCKVIFSSEDIQYVYKIPNYNSSYISIEMYLFDLKAGDYHIYFLLEQSGERKLYDTLYDIHK